MNIWRDRLSRWLAPAAASCPFSPNSISVAALLMNLAGAICLARGNRDPRLFLIALVLISCGGLADAFDGIVARTRQMESRFGDFLDHAADRLSDLALISGWMIGNGVRISIALVTLILVMLNGYLGTQIEATFGQRNYDSIGRGEFVLALIIFPLASYILITNHWESAGYPPLRATEWMLIPLAIFAMLGVVQRMRLASRLG